MRPSSELTGTSQLARPEPIVQAGQGVVLANGKPTEARLPCSIEQFLLAQSLRPAASSSSKCRPSRRPVCHPLLAHRRPTRDRQIVAGGYRNLILLVLVLVLVLVRTGN